MKKFAILVLCLVTILGVTACGSKESENEEGSQSGGGSNVSTYSLNQTITSNGAEYKLSNLTYDAGSGINIPEEGNQYAVVTVEIKNTSNASVEYSSRNFALVASDGKQYIPEVMLSNSALSAGTLAAGQTVSGTVYFQIPKSTTASSISLYADLLHNGTPFFTVNLK